MPGPQKEVKRHLDKSELDATIDAAQRENNAHLVRRLCLIENLYAGDSLTEAASRVGVSQPTASRWVQAWNTDQLTGLEPDFGGGRPPKLSPAERERLGELLENHQPLTTREIQILLEEGFDVSYSYRHVSRIIREIDINPVTTRTISLDGPEDPEEILDENLQAALDELEDDG